MQRHQQQPAQTACHPRRDALSLVHTSVERERSCRRSSEVGSCGESKGGRPSLGHGW